MNNKPMDTNRIESLLEQSKRPQVKPSDAQKTRMLNQIMANAPKASAAPAALTPWYTKRWFVIAMPTIGVGAMAVIAILLIAQPDGGAQLAQTGTTATNTNATNNNTVSPSTDPEERTSPDQDESPVESSTETETVVEQPVEVSQKKIAKGTTRRFTYMDLPCECGGGNEVLLVSVIGENIFSKNIPKASTPVLRSEPMNIAQAQFIADILISTDAKLTRYDRGAYDFAGSAIYATDEDGEFPKECFFDIAAYGSAADRCLYINNTKNEIQFTAPLSDRITEATAIQSIAKIMNLPVGSLQVDRVNSTTARLGGNDSEPITMVYVYESDKQLYGIPYYEFTWTIAVKSGYVELIQGKFQTAITERESVDLISPSEARDRLVEGLRNPVLENPNFNRTQSAHGFRINQLFEDTQTPNISIDAMELEYITWQYNTVIPVYRAYATIAESGKTYEYYVDATKQGDVFNRVSQK